MSQAKNELSLYELSENIKKAISTSIPRTVWLKAEILEFNRHIASGHCYFELIEKDKKTNKIIARCKATLWSYSARLLEPFFRSITGKPLQVGMNVLFNVSVEYNETYGLSLNIKDIDPTYTIGDIELQKQIIIKQLEEDGVMDLNKSNELTLVPQKIAIISSATAAGYGDFKEHLINNLYRFRFECTLFPALMQGNETEQSVIEAMDKVFEEDGFDVLVIIRGGGSKADLSAFDNYRIASYIAQFPIPVLTGIGHDRDESIADLVAYEALKTPTAVADFLISKLENFANEIENAEISLLDWKKTFFKDQKNIISIYSKEIRNKLLSILENEKKEINYFEKELKLKTHHLIQKEIYKLNQSQNRLEKNCAQKIQSSLYLLQNFELILKNSISMLIKSKNNELLQIEKHVNLVDPRNLAQRGYALLVQNGKVIKDFNAIDVNIPVINMTKQGSIASNIISITFNDNFNTTNVE